MKTQDRTIKKYMARPQSEVGKTISDYEDRTIRDVIFDKFYNNFSEQDLPLLNEIAEFAQQLKQPEKQCIGCNPELAGKDGGSPGHTCEATHGTALVEKQNKTIIFEIKINGEFNKIISDISLINGVESVQDITEEIGVALKQPEKQEIEIAEELFENDIDIVENRRLIIELQEVVNKLLKE